MKFFIILPLVLLFLGFLFGTARLQRAIIFFAGWLGLCWLLYISSLLYGLSHIDPTASLIGIIIAVAFAVPSFWFATLFSVATSKRVNPAPIQCIVNSYQALDDSKKQDVARFAKIGAGLAAKQGSIYLRKKGWRIAADALKSAAKLF